MTSIPEVEATAPLRPEASGMRVGLALCALAGFSGLLAEQGFEKYLQLLVGSTASASTVVLSSYFLGFSLGALAAAKFVREGRVNHPLLAFGVVQLAVGVACVLLSYCFHPLIPLLAPLQDSGDGSAWKLAMRFFCSSMFVLPGAALIGATFPLIAQVLQGRWPQAYAASLAGALAGSLLAPLLLMPIMGLRGAMWICLAIGMAICAAAYAQPGVSLHRKEGGTTARSPITPEVRLLLAAAFGSGLIFFALEVIWTHLVGVVLGSSVYAVSWALTAVLLGLLVGALLVDRAIRYSSLLQGAALLLTLQLVLWDHLPSFGSSFYLAEIFKLCVTILMLAPPAAAIGMIYPRLLASPHVQPNAVSYLSGYLSAAYALGCLGGALLAVFVLVPAAGAEGSLKLLAVVLAVLWLVFLLREPVERKRLATAAAAAIILVIVLLARWWNWGTLTAGVGNGHTTSGPSNDVHYLPASLIFRQEDMQGGFTTVVEQTVVSGEVARTVRTLFTNGMSQGDDNQPGTETQTRFGFPAVPSQFVTDHGRALLIGLGTGQSAAAFMHLGYREIVIAEISSGVVKAAQESFGAINEGILADSRVKLHQEDARNVLLTDRHTRYDLISIEVKGLWFPGAPNLYSREFYELAHSRLEAGGVFQQWVELHHAGTGEIASQLATAREIFGYASLWQYAGEGMLVAADHPLTDPHVPAGAAPAEWAQLAETLSAARLLDSAGVQRLIAGEHPRINTDQNRGMEYATPRYQLNGSDRAAENLTYLRRYR